ncbi:transcriptional regulator, Fur family [Anaerofustis stercorihominis DSM 17244]|uniref:Transcriptional regulator, Fur family n=2 Tax=Anaerofustis stercorihominis TaxID=214853 RepID=B1C6P8_9FIRM|nr:transcriptional repressor [Anaerofustis stercorihominis]EDS72685.1 transcriptional regulator, Fur family [Anaerofustis stercorihominis DSM 17244]
MENTRNTIQKKIIFNTLKSMKEHPSAQEVYEKVHEKHSTISRATVFRVLNNLASLGHLNRLRMPDMPDLYDYKTTGHYHIKCRECNDIKNVEVEFLNDIDKEVENDSGYKILNHNLVFEGICPTCQKDMDKK